VNVLSLKERILKEMLVDEDYKLAKEIYNELPVELKNYENFEKIMRRIKELKEVKK